MIFYVYKEKARIEKKKFVIMKKTTSRTLKKLKVLNYLNKKKLKKATLVTKTTCITKGKRQRQTKVKPKLKSRKKMLQSWEERWRPCQTTKTWFSLNLRK